jgi:hypothetical protein
MLPLLASAQRIPTEEDLQLPDQDLQEIQGEVVWLQGAIYRGSPQPYRDTGQPLAAYEQGILDETGQLWTILDTPKGRELRYNPDLRGKRINIKGWLHSRSRILDIKDWKTGKHQVRADEEYEPPPKLPFDPFKAETIESIPPIPLKQVDDEEISQDLWLMEEGYDLGVKRSPAKIKSGSPTAESKEIKRLLDTLDQNLKKQLLPPTNETLKGSSPIAIPGATPTLNLPSAIQEEPALPSTGRKIGEVVLPPPPPAPLTDDQGQPLTNPEDFDKILQKELIQQIAPKK